MELLSLRKALIKFYTGANEFTLDDVLSNNELIKTLRCSTPLAKNRVRDEVTGMIREKLVVGKITKRDDETFYEISGKPKQPSARPQFSKSMCIALGLSIPQ